MAGQLQQGGVRLVVQDFDDFVLKLGKANDALDQFSQNLNKTAGASQAAGQQAGEASRDFTALGLSLTAAGAAGAGLLATAGLTASRIEELGNLLEVTRRNAVFLAEAEGDVARASSLSNEAVQEQVRGIRDLHLSGAIANETVAQLIRYNLDWAKATELARLAQDAATFAAQDSSAAVDGLIRGITTLNPRVLRTYGLMINLNIAYEKFASANNVAVKDMTVAQRQQAAFNEVLAQAPSIAGAYEAAMGTAAKQLRSIATDVTNLAEEFGEEYTPALTLAVGTGRDFLAFLTELPDPIQAFIAYAGGAGSALATLTGTALLLGPRLGQLAGQFGELAAAMGISTGALLGAGGLIALMVGLAGAVYAAEQAHREEASAIAAGADNYTVYITRLDDAGEAAYGLTEGLYELVKAQEASNQAAYAKELLDTKEELMGLVEVAAATADPFASMTSLVERLGQELSYMQLEVLQDRDAVSLLGTEVGLTGQELLDFVNNVTAGAEATETARRATENYNRFEQERYKILTQLQQTGHIQALKDETSALADLNRELGISIDNNIALEAAVKNRTTTVQDATEEEEKYAEAVEKATRESVFKQIEAAQERVDAFEDLDQDYTRKAAALWRDYAREIANIEADIAAFHAGTLDELLDLEREAAQDRADAWQDYLRAVEDLEREFAQDLADLERERLRDLEDLNAEFAQDREDVLRDLAQSLEEIESEHLDNMRDLETEYYADLEELAKEAADRRASIEEKYARDRQAIFDKYDLDREEEPDVDALRQALIEEYESLEGNTSHFAERRRKEIEDELQELLNQELAALEERKKAELEELEKWLAEEEAAREEAYQTAREAELARAQEQREDAEREAEQRLEDLQRNLERERAEIERDYQRRLDDLRLQHEREKAEIDRRYQQRLDDINIQYERERVLIGEKLQEQLDTANEKYQEGLDDLGYWYDEQQQLINEKYADQIRDIERNVQEAVLKASTEFGKLPAAMEPVWNELITQGREKAARWVDDIIAEFQRLFDWLGVQSPSTKMQELTDGVYAGLSRFETDPISDLIGNSLGVDAMQANINAAIGNVSLPQVAQQVIAPQAAAGPVSTTYNQPLNVTANYSRPQSEASLRDDLIGINQMWKATARR